MNVSKVLTLASGAAYSLAGVEKLSFQADLAATLLRPASPAYTAIGDAFQISGDGIASAATERYTYGPTQMLGTEDADATGAINTIVLKDGGRGYAAGDTFHLIDPTGTNPHDEVITVVTVGPAGNIKTFTAGAQGSAYHLGVATAAGTATWPDGPVKLATFDILDVGTDVDAVITDIDVNLDVGGVEPDKLDHETFQVGIYRGGKSGTLVGTGGHKDYGDTHLLYPNTGVGSLGKISSFHIKTAAGTGAIAAGQVYAIKQSSNTTGRYTVVSVDVSADITSGYISTRGLGYSAADSLAMHLIDAAGEVTAGASGCEGHIVSIDDYSISTGNITFLLPTIHGTATTGCTQAPTGYIYPRSGDWLWCKAYLAGTLEQVFSSTQLGATPTVHANSSSTGAPIVQVACPTAGAMKTLAITAGGTGYEVGDILTITAHSGGSSGTGTVLVTSVNGTAVDGVTVLTGGSGHTVHAGAMATTNAMGGSSDDCTLGISAIAAASEYVTRQLTTTYSIAGTAPDYTVTWVDNGIPAAGDLVRVAHTFALNNKWTVVTGEDTTQAVQETYELLIDGTLKTLDTDFVIKGGLGPVGSVFPIGQVTTVTATAAAGDIVEVTQTGASGGRLTIVTVDGSDDVASATIQAAGTGYFAGTGLAVTKVSGSGTAHSAIRVTLLEADIDASHIFSMANKSPTAAQVVQPVVKTNGLALLKGDELTFSSDKGGYHYTHFIPGAAAIAAVTYG